MTRHPSYSASRSRRPSGSYGGQRDRGSKRNTYSRRSREDNKTLFALVYFILPFIAINLIILFLAVLAPKIDYTMLDTQGYKTVDLSIRIRLLLPLKEMTTTLETKPVGLVKEKGVYKTTLEDNGALEIQVIGWNGMTKCTYEHIATLDDTLPSIDEGGYVMEGGQLTVIASDSQSGVNYDAAYATDEKEETIKPVSINKDTGEITFAMDTPSPTVYIEDFAGNTSKAFFTNRTEDIDTGSRDSKLPSDSINDTSGNGSFSDSNTNSSSTKETTKTRETTRMTKATEKTKETIKATKATGKIKGTTKATRVAEKVIQATKATSATNATKVTKVSGSAESTTAPATSPTTAPTTPVVPGPGESSSSTQALTQVSRAVPGGDSNDVTIVPIT